MLILLITKLDLKPSDLTVEDLGWYDYIVPAYTNFVFASAVLADLYLLTAAKEEFPQSPVFIPRISTGDLVYYNCVGKEIS